MEINIGTMLPEEITTVLDRFRSESYSTGADAVWRMLGVGEGLPNVAIWDDAAGHYIIRPKQEVAAE